MRHWHPMGTVLSGTNNLAGQLLWLRVSCIPPAWPAPGSHDYCGSPGWLWVQDLVLVARLALETLLLASWCHSPRPGHRGTLMALNSTMFRTGQTVGPLTMGALLALGGMDAVFLGGGSIGLFTVLVLLTSMGYCP